MSYLKQFKEKIKNNDYPEFLKIWEEYCYSDEANYDELKTILIEVKKSDMAISFGQHVNRALFLWEKLKDQNQKDDILKIIVDIQNKNDEDLAEITYQYLKTKYHDDPLFNEKIRLIGLRNRDNYQGAISKYELLTHIKKGRFVFHNAGWGTGEILDFSLLREEIQLEFEYVVGHKSLSFENALKTLTPLPDTHFLSRRFGNPDLLEAQAKENPLEVIKMVLSDLGPLNSAEIKDALCDLVIPSDEWNKWWQSAKSKIKKDRKIESPINSSDPFLLREKDVDFEQILQQKFDAKPKPKEIIEMVNSFIKDYPDTLKNEDFRKTLILKLLDVLSFEELTNPLKLQIYFFLEILKADKDLIKIKEIIEQANNLNELIESIDILHFKKRLLSAIREHKKDWESFFLNQLLSINQNNLRDYILNELIESKSSRLSNKLRELREHPLMYPTAFFWFFQKVFSEKNILLSDIESKNIFFESFLILLDHLENKNEYKELAKKMIALLSSDRYNLVRTVMENASVNQAKEYLLLATKCRLLNDHDIKIIHSLAKVVHPNLEEYKPETADDDAVWATEDGFIKIKTKLNHLSTKEMIDNAKEIEEARAHGDLRENAEYKAALERRSRLQSEIRTLSLLINNVKIINKSEITTEKAEIGTIIECTNEKGEKATFTILGPFEADAEKNILSFQSKLAKDIIGKSVGEKFSLKNNIYTIVDIRSYFE
ncbi:MAG: GreA/GreB family elongation factor [Parachlamydiales bacterium]|jgi:transcription elongation factor GreA-like protein/transcription elongation GreA/GreB family factor